MDTVLFLVSLGLAAFGPILAIRYLRPILERVLRGLCRADGGTEFWIRAAYLMATTGTLLLTLVFGGFDPGTSVVETLRRTLLLTLVGVFTTVGIITANVWSQVREWLTVQRQTSNVDRES